MNKQSKRGKPAPRGAAAHPELQQPVGSGAPGAESSKVNTTKQRDARTGQDKDGNEEQPKKAEAAVSK